MRAGRFVCTAAYLDADAINERFAAARALLKEKTKHHPEVTAVLVKGHTCRTIIDYAADAGIDCIVMGSQSRGLATT